MINYYFKGLNAEILSDLLNKKMLLTQDIPVKNSSLTENFEKIYSRFQLGYSNENMVHISLLFSSFLTSILCSEILSMDFEDSRERFSIVIHYLKDNIHRNLKLKTIASKAYLSPSYFTYALKQITGYSPIEYFNHLKLQHASNLLHFHKMKIADIAKEIGIEDPYYFSR